MLKILLTFYKIHSESLIDVSIETAVARMQSVIDLGRIIRERNTLPIKVIIFFYK